MKLIIKNLEKSQELTNHRGKYGKTLIKLGFRGALAHAHPAREGCPLPATMHDGANLPFTSDNKRPKQTLKGDTRK